MRELLQIIPAAYEVIRRISRTFPARQQAGAVVIEYRFHHFIPSAGLKQPVGLAGRQIKAIYKRPVARRRCALA
jgi:hypothetical protein